VISTATARRIAGDVRSGKRTAREVVEESLARIEKYDGEIHAFVHVCSDEALARADGIDAAVARGETDGLLLGVPVAVKDNICTRNIPTTAASRILENYRPPYDAHVIERLLGEGAVIVGKTNQDEFGMGSTSQYTVYEATRNPWNSGRVPGGSSGGSAAAVAAGMVPIALGTDTGGSIRQPAAFCGVTGLKPTYGRVSRYGLIAFASSLDQIGPITADAPDAALALRVIAGRDERDSTSADKKVPAYDGKPVSGGSIEGLKIGLPLEYFPDNLDGEVAAAVRLGVSGLEKLGASVVEVSLPHTRYAIAAYYIIAPAEASSNLARYDGVHYGRRAESHDVRSLYVRSRSEGFGPEVQRRIMLGTFALSSGYYDAYYLKAQKVRTLVRRDFEKAFERCDLIVSPVAPGSAFPLGKWLDDPIRMYLGDVFTVPASLAGCPAVSVPCGMTGDGLPIGMQVIGPEFREGLVLGAAAAYQKATDHPAGIPSEIRKIESRSGANN